MTKKIISLTIIVMISLGVNFCHYEINAAGGKTTGVTGGIGDTIRDSVKDVIVDANKDTVDDTMQGAQDFLKEGQNNQINEPELKKMSDFLFNLLLAIAMVVAVIVGMVIGIQFMVVSVEEKAKVKESLLPYFVGCGVVFGAFGIWKLAVTILSGW
ncbi:MAG: hypothetical protein HFJ34_02290 [Clostridia bacterium]|nr:hypothetical protein [Clostridia bacterium]